MKSSDSIRPLKIKYSRMKKSRTKLRKGTLAFVLLLMHTLSSFPVLAGPGQVLTATTVTITLKSGSLESAIKQLQELTKVTFAYDKQLLLAYPIAEQRFSKQRLDRVLQELLKDKFLAFKEVNSIVVISRAPVAAPGLLTNGKRADIVVEGVVTDEKGQPMPGVSVAVRGVSTMTSTDNNGHFKLIVQSPQAVLAFSFIGYETAEVIVGNQTSMNVQLKIGSRALNEVAVVGFGTQRKVSLVGAQSTIKPVEFKQPAADISTMLAGRIAGIVGVQRSGEPGKSGADIWIRGISTFGDGNKATP